LSPTPAAHIVYYADIPARGAEESKQQKQSWCHLIAGFRDTRFQFHYYFSQIIYHIACAAIRH
jgi:hypothetical protein